MPLRQRGRHKDVAPPCDAPPPWWASAQRRSRRSSDRGGAHWRRPTAGAAAVLRRGSAALGWGLAGFAAVYALALLVAAACNGGLGGK